MSDIPAYNGTTDRADSGWATTGVHNLNIFYDVSNPPMAVATGARRLLCERLRN